MQDVSYVSKITTILEVRTDKLLQLRVNRESGLGFGLEVKMLISTLIRRPKFTFWPV